MEKERAEFSAGSRKSGLEREKKKNMLKGKGDRERGKEKQVSGTRKTLYKFRKARAS